jgi:hypothetical protein
VDVWRDDAAVRAVFPLPVMSEAVDPRGGIPLAGPHDTFVGVRPDDVTDRLFRMAVGAGRFSLGEAADAAGAPTLLLVPRALAGNAPGTEFRRAEIWQWLKCAAVDPHLGRGMARCPLSHRPCVDPPRGTPPPAALGRPRC